MTFVGALFILGVGAFVTREYKTGAAFASLQGQSRYFHNMSGHEVLDHLSEPGFIRKEGGVVVWQYENTRCILDIYFKDSQDGLGGMSVVHYEARPRDPNNEGTCGAS